MPIFLIAVVAIIVIIVAGIVLAKGTAVFDKTVQQNRVEMDKKASTGNGYNMALTMGYKIPVDADYETQVREARKLSAKRAAALPRGANNGIGRLGEADELKTAWQGVERDPVTAVKIAAYHGWDGLRTGFVVAPAAVAPTSAPAPAAADVELVPGKDYPVIEITDDMSPADIRKARIANAKAKSAANKAAKADGGPAAAPAAAAAPAPAAVTIPEPEMIEITDDMAPDEVRKARIANSKAKSAYNKALKAAGVDAQAAVAPAAAPVPAAAAPEPAAANVPPPPEMIEITDDMDPAAVRQARIANSKAKSAYNKALKAAGIDPQSVDI